MELQLLPSLTILVTTLLFLILILKILTEKPTKITKLPPGPWKLPLIGNLHQLVGGTLPHRRLRDLANKYGALMHLQIGEISTVVVSSAEYAEQVMKTHDIKFASRPYIPAAYIFNYKYTEIAFSPYGEYWRQLRKICTIELLSVKRVTSFKSIREEEVSKLIESIRSETEKGTPLDLTVKIYSLVNNVVCRAVFGKVGRDQEKYLTALAEAVRLQSGFNAADLFPSIEGFLMWVTGMKAKVEKAHLEADQVIRDIIDERRRFNEKSDDLLGFLLKAEESNDADFRFAADTVKAVIWDIIGAGSETSATLIDWAISELMKNPSIMRKVQVEIRDVFDKTENIDETCLNHMKYFKAVVKETLRLHPPVPLLLPRECRETCRIDGFDIPVKTKVIINSLATGMDSKYWSKPENFNPERFLNSRIDYRGNDFEFIPFGAGRRICPGISFGVANTEFSLAMLLYHFDWKFPDGIKCEDMDMTEEFGLSVRRKEHNRLIPIPYHL